MPQSISNYKEDFILFVEAGFIAVKYADEDSALKLFKAAEILNEKSQLPKVGYGYLHMCKLELKQAALRFREVLEKEPDNTMAETFLGICLSWTPDQMTEGEKILEKNAKESDDTGIRGLAKSALDFVDRFVKTTPTPAELQAKKVSKTKKKSPKH
ncbi:MAG: hypothetical protein S4CHLAM102_04830 [Chlamydiia bacterium]|nr:hypothetical protein [Chlamydiia bacterium]